MRFSTLPLLLILSGCPAGTLRVVKAVAAAVGTLCDTLAGGRSAITYGPPPPQCLGPGG